MRASVSEDIPQPLTVTSVFSYHELKAIKSFRRHTVTLNLLF